MLSKIITELDIPDKADLSIYKSSIFHGAMMEIISSEYAELMHASALKPFSQHLSRSGDKWLWTVSTLTDEAAESIINPVSEADDIFLTHDNTRVHISSREIIQSSLDELFEKNYYGEKRSRFVSFDIITPISFKYSGRYFYYPDPMTIIQNIIHKYDAVSDKTEIYEKSLMDELSQAVELASYNIHSTSFFLEGVKIPAFTGRITLKISGNQNIVSLVNMLADFSEFSGIGIKTALGMGAVKHINDTGKERMKCK